jgi:hypothetical protein
MWKKLAQTSLANCHFSLFTFKVEVPIQRRLQLWQIADFPGIYLIIDRFAGALSTE